MRSLVRWNSFVDWRGMASWLYKSRKLSVSPRLVKLDCGCGIHHSFWGESGEYCEYCDQAQDYSDTGHGLWWPSLDQQKCAIDFVRVKDLLESGGAGAGCHRSRAVGPMVRSGVRRWVKARESRDVSRRTYGSESGIMPLVLYMTIPHNHGCEIP